MNNKKNVPPDGTPENLSSNQRVVVVLGMHRSGTSALMRGLQALGVELGDSLLPAQADNPKGFFEDSDIVAFNDELLRRADRTWASLEPIKAALLTGPAYFKERSEAATLLRRKLRDGHIFGMKDPRLSVLLPFWQRVFDDLGVRADYVIGLRNPLETALSLEARDGMSIEASVVLWGIYMLGALESTQGARRAIISFEKFLTNPLRQLQQIATAIDLPIPKEDSPEILEFADDFMDAGLRNQFVAPRELRESERVYAPIAELYERLLESVSADQDGQKRNAAPEFEDLLQQFDDLGPILHLLDQWRADALVADHRRKIVQAAHDDACSQRDSILQERNNIEHMRQVAQAAHDDACRQRDDLQHELSIVEHQRQVAQAAHDDACRQRDDLQHELNIVEHRRQVAQAAHDDACRQRDDALSENAKLAKALADQQIAYAQATARSEVMSIMSRHQSETLAALAAELENAKALIDTYQNSTSWKVTAPVRGIVRAIKGEPSVSPASHGAAGRIWRLAAHSTALKLQGPPELPPRVLASNDSASDLPKGPFTAIVLHAGSSAQLEDVLNRIGRLEHPFKLYLTAPDRISGEALALLSDKTWPHMVIETDARGGDASALMVALDYVRADHPDMILKLRLEDGYGAPSHVHSNALVALLGDKAIDEARARYAADRHLGILAPPGHILSVAEFAGSNRDGIAKLSKKLGIDPTEVWSAEYVAGAMYFASPDVFAGLNRVRISATDFEPQRGQTDGTLAHAFERLSGAIARGQGLKIETLSAARALEAQGH